MLAVGGTVLGGPRAGEILALGAVHLHGVDGCPHRQGYVAQGLAEVGTDGLASGPGARLVVPGLRMLPVTASKTAISAPTPSPMTWEATMLTAVEPSSSGWTARCQPGPVSGSMGSLASSSAQSSSSARGLGCSAKWIGGGVHRPHPARPAERQRRSLDQPASQRGIEIVMETLEALTVQRALVDPRTASTGCARWRASVPAPRDRGTPADARRAAPDRRGGTAFRADGPGLSPIPPHRTLPDRLNSSRVRRTTSCRWPCGLSPSG